MIFSNANKTGVQLRHLLCCLFFVSFSELLAQPSVLTEGVYTVRQASQGEELYLEHCAHCHNEEFYKISLSSWSAMTILDYWYRIRGSMPADKSKFLTSKEYLAIVACVLSINGFPAGPEALEPGNCLGQLKFSGLR